MSTINGSQYGSLKGSPLYVEITESKGYQGNCKIDGGRLVISLPEQVESGFVETCVSGIFNESIEDIVIDFSHAKFVELGACVIFNKADESGKQIYMYNVPSKTRSWLRSLELDGCMNWRKGRVS